MAALRYVLAADIGGTSMRAAVVAAGGRILARAVTPTEPARGLADATGRLAMLLQTVAVQAGAPPLAAVGVATAGPVDPVSGVYRHPPNLPGWHGASMRPLLETALELPLAIGHDATLAALAETRFGARRGARHLLYLTVSTGIGAGIIADGHPLTGSTGGAGEVGHLIVQPGGPACGVGCPGCLEGVASGTAIAAAAARALAAGARSTLPRAPTATDVFTAAAAGDALARGIVDGAIEGLATGLAGLLAVFDPEAIVLGGGVMQGLAGRWDDLLERTRAIALPRYADGVPVERTTLGDDASLLGAAVVAFEAARG